MHILIAGGTGVIGRRIVPRLLERAHEVTVMTRHVDRARLTLPLSVSIVHGNVLDREETAQVLSGATPDVVLHQLTDLSTRNFAANANLRVEGTRSLVDASLQCGVRRMVVQSIAWCYVPGNVPATEEVPLDEEADSPARRSSVAAVAAMEREARRLPEWVTLRNGAFYGPGTWYWPDGATAEQVREGRLNASPAVTSFIHVDDAAAAAVDALAWPTGAVNIVDDEPATAFDWLPTFARIVGAPEPPLDESAEPWERGASNRRARELGWAPRWESWRTGFASAA